MMRRCVVLPKNALGVGRSATLVDCATATPPSTSIVGDLLLEKLATAPSGVPLPALAVLHNSSMSGEDRTLTAFLERVGISAVSLEQFTTTADAEVVRRNAVAASVRQFLSSPAIASTEFTTADRFLAHYFLNQQPAAASAGSDSPAAALVMKNFARQLWTREILMADAASVNQLSPAHQLQFQQLLDYWALQSANGIPKDVADRLLARFQTLEAVEAYCAKATGEQQTRLLSVLNAARDLRLKRDSMLPNLEAGEAQLTQLSTEPLVERALGHHQYDLSLDVVNDLKALGLELNQAFVEKARERLAPPPFIATTAKRHMENEAPVTTVVSTTPTSSLISDAELFDALSVIQQLADEKQAEYAAVKDIIRSSKEETKNCYLDYLLNEYNRFCDVFDAENPTAASPLPSEFFTTLRSTNDQKGAVKTILDEACDQVATSDPAGLGLEPKRFVSFFEMLDEAVLFNIDFSLASQGFQPRDFSLTGSQILAQRLVASELPYAKRTGIHQIREKLQSTGSFPRSAKFEEWHNELAGKHLIAGKGNKKGTKTDKKTAVEANATPLTQLGAPKAGTLEATIRDILYHMQPSPSSTKKIKLAVLHINAADNLFLQMLHHRKSNVSRIAAVKLYAATLTSLFEAKHRLMWENILLVPVITGLSTDYCPELDHLESTHYGFAAVLDQLRRQDPRRLNSEVSSQTTDGEVAATPSALPAAHEILTDANGTPIMIDPKGMERMRQLPLRGQQAMEFAAVGAAGGVEGSTPFAAALAEQLRRTTPQATPDTYISTSEGEAVQEPISLTPVQATLPAEEVATPVAQTTVATAAPAPAQPTSLAEELEALLGVPEVETSTAATAQTPTLTPDQAKPVSNYVAGFGSERALSDAAESKRAADAAIQQAIGGDKQLAQDILAVGKAAAEHAAGMESTELIAEILFKSPVAAEVQPKPHAAVGAAQQEQATARNPVVGATN